MTADPAPARHGFTRQDVFAVLGALGALLTLATGVMYYFGWRRSDVQASEMRVDVSLFGFSSQDYVLRSVSALYLPMLLLLVATLAWVWLHRRLVRLLGTHVQPDVRRRFAVSRTASVVAGTAAALASAAVLFAVVAGSVSPSPVVVALTGPVRQREWVVPVVLVLGTVVATYAWWVRGQVRPSRSAEATPAWQAVLTATLVAGLVVLGGFWVLEEYASAVGRGYARQLVAGVDRLARAAVISPVPLGIEAPGVREQRIGPADSPAVRYRTTGLRLLARSGGKVLLVHEGWTPQTGTVIVLPDSDELGWQFSR